MRRRIPRRAGRGPQRAVYHWSWPAARVLLAGCLLVGSLVVSGVLTFAPAPPAGASAPPLVLGWGDNSFGQLSVDTTVSDNLIPLEVPLPEGVVATSIADGGSTVYAIGSDGHLYAWGYDADGELGDGVVLTTGCECSSSPTVVPLPPGVAATSIVAGNGTAYAIGSDGNLYAWGLDDNGEAGNGTTITTGCRCAATPVEVSLPAGITPTAVADGSGNGYAIGSDGNLYAWGLDDDGGLGNGTSTTAGCQCSPSPVAVALPPGVSPSTIAAGDGTGYAVGSDGKLYAWGLDVDGELGNGTTVTTGCLCSATPVVVSLPPGVDATAIAANERVGYAMASDGHVYAWGSSGVGALGSGTTTASSTPVVVSLPAGVTPTAIAAGSGNGYAIGADGQVYAWGYDANGELGAGYSTELGCACSETPVVVQFDPGMTPTAIAAGGETAFAVATYAATTLDQDDPVSGAVVTGTAYADRLEIGNEPAAGGQLTWTTTSAAAPVTVTSWGAVSAPATASPGTYVVTGTVTDVLGDSGSWSITLTVAAQCTPGYFSATGGDPCSPAPPGTFVPGSGGTVAVPCPMGSYSAGSAASACTTAPAGTYVDATGTVVPTDCPAGTYNSMPGATGPDRCLATPPGTYVVDPGSSWFVVCAVGSYSATQGATRCTPADPGSYVPYTDQSQETACPAGFFTADDGEGACTPADPGSFVPTSGATAEMPCGVGTYSPIGGQAGCTTAGPGTYVGAPGQAEPTPCAAGTYSDEPGATDCLPAPANTYVATTGASAPTPCPPGTFTTGPASNSAAACVVMAVTTTTLPTGSVYAKKNKDVYAASLTAQGGTAPYKWSFVYGSGPLPPGLKMTAKGLIKGKASMAGTYTFTVQVMDEKPKGKATARHVATAVLSITIG